MMKALSVRAPWWWFILHGGKDIENRDWPTHFRGTVLLHSSKWFGLEDVSYDAVNALDIVRARGQVQTLPSITYRQMKERGGAIVGKVDIVDCVSQSDSPWFFGKYGFVLANPVAFDSPIPFKGSLGFFYVPDSLTSGACCS